MFYFNFLNKSQKQIVYYLWLILFIVLSFWVINAEWFNFYIFYDVPSSSLRRFQFLVFGGLILPMLISFLLYLYKILKISVNLNKTIVPKVSAILILAIMIFGVEYSYYDILRLICCGLFGYILFYEKEKVGWFVTWIISIMILQPLLKLNFERDLWIIIDVALITILIFSLFSSNNKNGIKNNNSLLNNNRLSKETLKRLNENKFFKQLKNVPQGKVENNSYFIIKSSKRPRN